MNINNELSSVTNIDGYAFKKDYTIHPRISFHTQHICIQNLFTINKNSSRQLLYYLLTL